MTGPMNGAKYEVGYKRPPAHSRFQKGRSGNPSGRPKDSKNFKTLLNQILNEQISLQDGVNSRKVSKREAIARRLIIGALKGDSRDLQTLLKLAEQTGEFESDAAKEPLTIRWVTTYEAKNDDCGKFPAISQINRD
jgi:hypothetical protein